MKIYIAGKITGDPFYKDKFQREVDKLTSNGHIVINPAALPYGMSKQDYMKICISMIDVADKICFLPDFKYSQGAMLELNYALYTDKEIEML